VRRSPRPSGSTNLFQQCLTLKHQGTNTSRAQK
jgi:hypothetical protein